MQIFEKKLIYGPRTYLDFALKFQVMKNYLYRKRLLRNKLLMYFKYESNF